MKAVVWVVKNAYEAGEFETKIGAHVNIIGDIRRYDGNLNSEIDNYVTYTGPLDEPPNAKFFVNANKEAAGSYDYSYMFLILVLRVARVLLVMFVMKMEKDSTWILVMDLMNVKNMDPSSSADLQIELP